MNKEFIKKIRDTQPLYWDMLCEMALKIKEIEKKQKKGDYSLTDADIDAVERIHSFIKLHDINAQTIDVCNVIISLGA